MKLLPLSVAAAEESFLFLALSHAPIIQNTTHTPRILPFTSEDGRSWVDTILWRRKASRWRELEDILLHRSCCCFSLFWRSGICAIFAKLVVVINPPRNNNHVKQQPPNAKVGTHFLLLSPAATPSSSSCSYFSRGRRRRTNFSRLFCLILRAPPQHYSAKEEDTQH